jgi:hypothetical protein
LLRFERLVGREGPYDYLRGAKQLRKTARVAFRRAARGFIELLKMPGKSHFVRFIQDGA